MALAAFYWPPRIVLFACGAVDISRLRLLLLLLLLCPSSTFVSVSVCDCDFDSIRNDVKVLSMHATWRMRNIYLCQLSLIAIQCQHRCPSASLPVPLSVVFAMFTYVSFPSGLVEHIRPIWRPISALRFSERATNCR